MDKLCNRAGIEAKDEAPRATAVANEGDFIREELESCRAIARLLWQAPIPWVMLRRSNRRECWVVR